MRRRLQQVSGQLVIGWLLAVFGTSVYLLTAEPTVSFWDCGEFIASSFGLQLGHPPGAPLYQLLAHCTQWLAGGDISRIAFFTNFLSALAGGVTVMFLYWTIIHSFSLLGGQKDPSTRTSTAIKSLAALAGSLCYLFCDTAWSSAIESEVYSLASLMAAVLLWAMMRWSLCTDYADKVRWLCLVALLTGLSVCVHLLALLVIPALLLIFWFSFNRNNCQFFRSLRFVPLLAMLFFAGLSPYAMVALRAHVPFPLTDIHHHAPPLADYNYVWSDADASTKSYVTRDHYQKAPLYPRMWRDRANDNQYYDDWVPDRSFSSQVQFFATYQLGYMYFRYLLWNFSGKFNDQQGFGSLQNGQFITGWPLVDRFLVGTGATPPQSLATPAHNRYFMIPLLLGVIGLCVQASRNRKMFLVVLAVFLFGGIFLSVFLNHPLYEPRERDYAYVLSFYAFAVWIAWGCHAVASAVASKPKNKPRSPGRHQRGVVVAVALLAVPAWMAAQNWDDHNRSNRYVAYDVACNMLNSCDNNAILFTFGDNDTFPLWYVQQVENKRSDIAVANISLLGAEAFMSLLFDNIDKRPIYFSHYAYDKYVGKLGDRFSLHGFTYRLNQAGAPPVDVDAFLHHIDPSNPNAIQWHSLSNVYVDAISATFLERYWEHVLMLVQQLNASGRTDEAERVMQLTLRDVPLNTLRDVELMYQIVKESQSEQLMNEYRDMIQRQLNYFYSIPHEKQQYIPYSIEPRVQMWKLIGQ